MSLLLDLRSILFPRYCAVCQSKLATTEKHLCVMCLSTLPRTRFHQPTDNPVAEKFFEWKSFVRGIGWLHYQHANAYSRLIQQAKYNDQPRTGQYLARQAAFEISQKEESHDFFDNIDYIVPIPLSRKRERRRGYNQSDYIAQGLSDITHIPVSTKNLRRFIHNKTQTRLSRESRRQNVDGIFRLAHPDVFRGKHILLVDDVMTTGATLSSCIKTLEQAVPDIHVSVFVLACTRQQT